jgi:hypothetical protein
MAQPIRGIPIEHAPAIYPIEANEATQPRAPLSLTLLELVQAVSEVSESEQEIIGTVVYMLHSRRVRLVGNFRDCVADDFSG